MNNTPFWACAALCLTAIGCALPKSGKELRHPLPCTPQCRDIDCSGLASRDIVSVIPATTPLARLPYGFRWDEYQGADIEHDIYGDRQRASHVRAVSQVQSRPAGACTLGAVAVLGGGQPAECGCEAQAATPPMPVPEPLTTVPSAPVEPKLVESAPTEPVPGERIPVEPTPVEPAPLEPKPADPAPTKSVPIEEKPTEPTHAEPTPVPPRNVIPRRSVVPPRNVLPQDVPPSQPTRVQPQDSVMIQPTNRPANSLIPTQILPAVPPAGIPVTEAPEVRHNELRRNTIPANSGKSTTNGTKRKANFGDSLYGLLLGG